MGIPQPPQVRRPSLRHFVSSPCPKPQASEAEKWCSKEDPNWAAYHRIQERKKRKGADEEAGKEGSQAGNDGGENSAGERVRLELVSALLWSYLTLTSESPPTEKGSCARRSLDGPGYREAVQQI